MSKIKNERERDRRNWVHFIGKTEVVCPFYRYKTEVGPVRNSVCDTFCLLDEFGKGMPKFDVASCDEKTIGGLYTRAFNIYRHK